jgi:hypothetical protein
LQEKMYSDPISRSVKKVWSSAAARRASSG